jgi:predicted nucleic-acid-binding protein
MNGSVDTNVLLRLIIGDVDHQVSLASSLIESTKGQLGVADVVFFELEHALTKNYGYTRGQAAEVLTYVAMNPKLNCNKHLIVTALSMYKDLTGVSFTDAALSVYATVTESEPLWTFDKALSRKLESAKLLA